MSSKILNLMLLAMILSSCTIARVPTYETQPAKDDYYKRKTIVENAQTFLGRKYINVEGRRYNYDCSGFVLAVYHKSGIDILGKLDPDRNLARSIYEYVQKDGIIYKGNVPKPGDIVFFSETLRSGRRDLSHIGIVESSDPNGTVSFIHKSTRGIKRSFLNLATPSVASENDTVANSYLRRRRLSDPPGTKYLAGELFAGYGSIIGEKIGEKTLKMEEKTGKKTEKAKEMNEIPNKDTLPVQDAGPIPDTSSIPTIDLSTQSQQNK